MPDWPTFSIFLLAAIVLLITPGPAVLYVVARSIEQGRLAGVVSSLGIGLGTVVHVIAAAFGVSAILAASATVFSIVKYLGAAYLIILGLRKIFSREDAQPDAQVERQSLRRIFYEGIWVNLLNPKTALFFFAFLPQFAEPAKGSPVGQIILLGSIFIVLAFFSDSMYAVLAGTLGKWLRGNRSFISRQRFLVGGTYIMLGVATALSGSRHNK